MAVLQSMLLNTYMVAYLEKTDGNTDFHEIIEFLTRSSIHYALTISTLSANVAAQACEYGFSEASIKEMLTDLLFDDADGIDSMHNQAIFDAIQLMGLTISQDLHLLIPIPDSIPEGSGGNHKGPTVNKEIIEEKVDAKGVCTAEPKDGNSNESAAPTTVFRDDETIAEFLVSMSQTKAKQKDKGKKVTEEEAEFVVQEDWEVEEEMKKLDEEEATKAALIQDFDDIQARIEADRLLAARLQEEEGEHFTVKREPNFFMILLLSKEVPCLTKVSCCNQKQTTNKNSAKKPNDDLSEACRTKEAC
ncbi:hypothetical protein Tco_0400489 [Tanacetum coccineum]